MSDQTVFTTFKALDRSTAVVALDYNGTKERYKKMISEWLEASEGRDLFGLQGNVGALLMDFGTIIQLPVDEIYSMLKG